MGQITNPSAPGITVLPVDRQTGPSAGPGNTGNLVLLFGANAGTNNVANQVIILGNGALVGGVTDANLAGTIAIGVNAAAASVSGSSFNVAGGNIVIGLNASAASIYGGNSVVIGDSAFEYGTGAAGGNTNDFNVIVGAKAAQYIGRAGSRQTDNVIIGAYALQGEVNPVFPVGTGGSVVIGFKAGQFGMTGGTAFSDMTLIGANAGQNLGNNGGGTGNTIAIGSACVSGLVTDNYSVYVGSGMSTGVATTSLNVAVGAQITGAGSSANVTIGNAATQGNANIGCILIGTGAGTINAASVAGTGYVALEYGGEGGGGTGALLYGNMISGNAILGKSDGTNRDLNGTNTLKLLNGTKGVAPIGGGYFYVVAGALHWVDAGGVDNLLSIGTAGQLAASSVLYTNNAGAQIATITNGPTAGNPTKWIPINDNGTIRNIPAW